MWFTCGQIVLVHQPARRCVHCHAEIPLHNVILAVPRHATNAARYVAAVS